MDHQSHMFEKMNGSLEDRFELLDAIGGTLTAKAYRAIDRSTNKEVTVWRTRGPLQSGELNRLQERLVVLQRTPRVESILSCGVDSSNRGFAVLRAHDGRRIDSPAKSREEIEERFDGCAAIVEALHEKGITCGDICLESFLLKDRGGITLFAVLGDVALQREDEEVNRNRYVAFRPPDQKKGGRQPPSVDLYALSRLGEGLSAISIVEDKTDATAAPSLIKKLKDSTSAEERPSKNAAAKNVRLTLGEEDKDAGPERPPEEIAELQRAALEQLESAEEARGKRKKFEMQEGRELPEPEAPDGGGFNPRTLPRISLKELVSMRGMLAALNSFIAMLQNPSRVLLLAMLNILGLGVLFYSYIDNRATATAAHDHTVVAMTKRKSDDARIAALYNAESATAYQELIKLSSEATDPGQREQTLKVLTFRARRLGLARTSDVVLDQILDAQDLATFGKVDQSRPLLQLLDPELTSSARLEELARLYAVSPGLATRLAAASALDSGDAEAYRGLFAKAVADQTGISNAGDHNPYALMLLVPDVHALFSEDIVAVQEKIPSDDVVWLLDELGRQGRPEVSTAAQIAERRDVITGGHAVFLKELRRSAALKQRIRTAMVSGALGKLSVDDVRSFNEWYGQGSSRALEAAILTTSNGAVKQGAFNALMSKPIDDPYVARVMEFIRSAYGEESARYAGVVAALDLREGIGREGLSREFDALQDAPRSKELLKQLVQGAPPEVIEVVLERYSGSMDQLDIVDLLAHPSPQIRVAAVSSLTNVNDIMLLKLISQSYEEEKEPTVRAAYEEKISIVKERLS